MNRGTATPCHWQSAPLEPLSLSDGVHVWCGVVDQPQDCDAMTKILSDEELTRASRFHFAGDRQRFIGRRYMLRTILAEYLRLPPRALEFIRGVHGKLEVRTGTRMPDMTFSLSHSNGVALCALSRSRRVGVDVEWVRPLTDMEPIAERVFSAEELPLFLALPESTKERAFFELWTRKEACVKAVGLGLSAPLRALTVLFGADRPTVVHLPFGGSESSDGWSLLRVNLSPEFEAAVCVEGPAADVVCWRFSPALSMGADVTCQASHVSSRA